MSDPKPTAADPSIQIGTWGQVVCMCCHMWFDYLKRDGVRVPFVCRTCAGDNKYQEQSA